MQSIEKILIENTKGIRKLEFTLPELSGVYLIVGANGTGKTTLLTCLDRLCNPLAFSKGFEASRLAHEIDQILRSPEYTACNAQQARKLAKDQFSVVLRAVTTASGQNEALSLDALIGFLINSIPDGQIRQVLGPIVGR